jgi:hypothetical protein
MEVQTIQREWPAQKGSVERLSAPKQPREHRNGPDLPGWSNATSVFHSKSVLYGAFVWARRALNSQKRRFWARAAQQPTQPTQPQTQRRPKSAPPFRQRRVAQNSAGADRQAKPPTPSKQRRGSTGSTGGRGGRRPARRPQSCVTQRDRGAAPVVESPRAATPRGKQPETPNDQVVPSSS